MKAVPVETIDKIISNIKSELAIELLKALVNAHAVEISSVDNSKFEKLVARIREIDPSAADWVMDNQSIMYKESNTLMGLFSFPRGTGNRWRYIARELGER